MRKMVTALVFLAATPAAQASSFVTLGEPISAGTPSFVTAGEVEPVQSASLVYLGSAAPATAFDQERERAQPAPRQTASPTLAQASLPTVMRGGIQGEAFSRGSLPAAQPATASPNDAVQPAAPAAAKGSAPARPSEPRRRQEGDKPPTTQAPAVPVDAETTAR